MCDLPRFVNNMFFPMIESWVLVSVAWLIFIAFIAWLTFKYLAAKLIHEDDSDHIDPYGSRNIVVVKE